MIFVDSNVPMYLIGASHEHKVDARHALERLVTERERLVTDAEVLQEILHRYSAIGRRDAIQPAFDVLLAIVDEIFPVDIAVVQRAKAVLLARERLSTRCTSPSWSARESRASCRSMLVSMRFRALSG